MSNLQTRDRRVLIGGGTAMLLIVGLGRGVPAILRWTADLRQRAVSATMHVGQVESQIRSAKDADRLLGAVRQRLAAYDSAYLAGTSPSTAGASLATLLTDAADESGSQLGVVQLTVDSSTGSRGLLGRAKARATVSGDLESIATFVEWLEEGPQLVVVRELSITQSDPHVPPGRVEMLQAEVVVEGVFRVAITGPR